MAISVPVAATMALAQGASASVDRNGRNQRNFWCRTGASAGPASRDFPFHDAGLGGQRTLNFPVLQSAAGLRRRNLHSIGHLGIAASISDMRRMVSFSAVMIF